jgi:predicted CopG family antitoxin
MVTTIQVKNETLERLKYFKEHGKESYDEVINRILNKLEDGEFSDEFIRGIKRGIEDVRNGKTKPIESVAKDLGIRL